MEQLLIQLLIKKVASTKGIGTKALRTKVADPY